MDQRERTARNPFTKRALRPLTRPLSIDWRMLVGGVCCSHYGLRLIVVRTATLLMRRLLVVVVVPGFVTRLKVAALTTTVAA
jgi:hypothetical protein